MLKDKKIILGVCGSIAAYKTATLVRLLVKQGAQVKVILTADAAHFITPLTLATLSKNPVYSSYFDEETGVWSNHVELGLWADFILIAPATANTIAKCASGVCDNLLTAVYLSARCPVYFVPAMDLDMWQHPATQQNIQTLVLSGNKLIAPATGELASGLSGQGRMEEPEEIVHFLTDDLKKGKPLHGTRALVTAGPTFEAIDPVRFIGNHSSGKMGFAIAETLHQLGADVTLVSGPSAEVIDGVKRIDIVSANDMLTACLEFAPNADIVVMTAAVADYTPANPERQKIKKNTDTLTLELAKTTDILAELGKLKNTDQILVGFALETENEIENALGKLRKKNLDLLILNSMNDTGAGFKTDSNKITIFNHDEQVTTYPLKSKKAVAKDICMAILDVRNSKNKLRK